MTLAFLDVHYGEATASAACVLACDWRSNLPLRELVVIVDRIEAYIPGEFYRRELPCLLAVLGELSTLPTTIIVDGYVWVGDDTEPGLGAHLYKALGSRIPIIGVAKTRFLKAKAAVEVTRGESHRPLFVSAVGIDVASAAQHVKDMHGDHRVPTLLRKVDQLCRGDTGT